MSYQNPLHPPIEPTQFSSYSSLSGATASSQSSSQFISPFRRRLPQSLYTPASKWRNATGRSNVVHAPISFDFKGYRKQGVPMRELSARSIPGIGQMIEDPDDLVLADTGLSRITFRIMWPGYTHVEWVRSIVIVASNGPITRAQLGQNISRNFSRFIEMNREQTSSSAENQIGPTGIKFEHLIIVGLFNVFEDSWQADVAVDRRWTFVCSFFYF